MPLAETAIIIADDHPIFRQGLKQIIETEPGFRVIAEAPDGEAALNLITTHRPAIAILDLNMPRLDGLAVAGRVQDLNVPTRLIILTMHTDEFHLNKAIKLDIPGYIIKDSAATEVIDCLKKVTAGGQYFSPALSSFLVNRRRRGGKSEQLGTIEDLTPTERRIMALLADLKTSKEIAAALNVSPRTIDNHRAHICVKLDLQGSHALTKFAIQHKEQLS